MVGRLENLPPREGRRVMKERQRERGSEGGEERQRENSKKEEKKIRKISPTHHGKKTTRKKNIPRIRGWGLPCSPCPKGHLTLNH